MISHLSHVPLFATLETVAHQAPLSMGFSRQEYWSGLPSPPPEDLPNPGIKPRSHLHWRKILCHWASREAIYAGCEWVIVAQSSLTLFDPMDWSLPGSSIHEISQARLMEWVAISFSRGSFRPRDRTWVSCVAGEYAEYIVQNAGLDEAQAGIKIFRNLEISTTSDMQMIPL